MRGRLIVVIALAMLTIAGVACSSGSSASGKTLDATYTRFDGSTGSFTEFRGKPVVVNFFSSTCSPCVREMPSLEQLHRTLGDSVTFVGMDVQDTVDAGQSFVEAVGVTWQLGRDPDAEILQKGAGGVALPTTVVLDPQGRIVYSHLGVVDTEELTKQLRAHGAA